MDSHDRCNGGPIGLSARQCIWMAAAGLLAALGFSGCDDSPDAATGDGGVTGPRPDGQAPVVGLDGQVVIPDGRVVTLGPDGAILPVDAGPPPDPTILDDTFRIDLSTIRVSYEVDPSQPNLQGQADLTFRMRPAQQRPLFHFDPILNRGNARDTLTALALNGETLDPGSDNDLRVIGFPGSEQDAFELQRDLAPNIEHTLHVEWTIPFSFTDRYFPFHDGWFWTQVNDIYGWGNEAYWPTINAPHELARHVIELRIQSPDEYFMIGSGSITNRRDGNVQVWTLDTLREISSYTVLLVAMPRDDVNVRTFTVGTVPVTVAATTGQAAQAERITRDVLSSLIDDFGPYPAPELHILIDNWDDGMEYYAGTITDVGILSHELVHMYWGCSAVGRTWRDTWFDEAITVWWDESINNAIGDNFESDMVSGWGPIEIGFDTRAYGQGARIIAAIADELGGNGEMTDFLKDVHQRRAFTPFTTREFIDDVVAATGNPEMQTKMERWLFDSQSATDY